MGDETKLMQYHQQLTESIEDQLSLASIHFQRSHYQVGKGGADTLVKSGMEKCGMGGVHAGAERVCEQAPAAAPLPSPFCHASCLAYKRPLLRSCPHHLTCLLPGFPPRLQEGTAINKRLLLHLCSHHLPMPPALNLTGRHDINKRLLLHPCPYHLAMPPALNLARRHRHLQAPAAALLP